ncbi:MAG: hypothetical protein NTZ05_22015 [Chloroflexi bacterium]|nr:hypothetical protein [Chloroflexota bacterium]
MPWPSAHHTRRSAAARGGGVGAAQRHLEKALSRGILRNQFTAGQTIMVDADGGKLTFHVKELEPALT